MKQFNIGTMDDAIYPAQGSFDDWAYAGSWYRSSKNPNSIANYNKALSSPNCQYTQYPIDMTRSLVYLFQLGPFNINQTHFGTEEGVFLSPDSQSISNGYISRSIRMIKELLKVVEPKLEVKLVGQQILMRLEGCGIGEVKKIKLFRVLETMEKDVYFQVLQAVFLNGTINQFQVQPISMKLLKNLFDSSQLLNQSSKTLKLQYQLNCDPDWVGKGKTIFGQKRQFKIKQQIFINTIRSESNKKQNKFYLNKQQAIKSFKFISANDNSFMNISKILSNKKLVMFGIIMILVLIFVIMLIRAICKQLKKDKIKMKLQHQLSNLSTDNMNELTQSTNNQLQTQENQLNQNQYKYVRSNNKNNTNVNNNQTNYPYMCDSDKSIHTQNLNQEQILSLQQFVKSYDQSKE